MNLSNILALLIAAVLIVALTARYWGPYVDGEKPLCGPAVERAVKRVVL